MRQRKKYQGVSGSSIVTQPLPSYIQQQPTFVGQMLQQPPIEFNPTGYNGTQSNWQNPEFIGDPVGNDPTLRIQPVSTPGQITAPSAVNAPSDALFPQQNQASQRGSLTIGQRSAWGTPNPNTLLPLMAANTIMGGIATRHDNNQREREMRKRLNNPYLGQLGANNGRSDDVRFGYRTYQQGGDVKFIGGFPIYDVLNIDKSKRDKQSGKATAADSLEIYKNSLKVQDYYKNLPVNKKLNVAKEKINVQKTNEKALNEFAEALREQDFPFTNRSNRFEDPNITMDEYYRPVDKNKYYQREINREYLDLNAPMQLFDNRIQPQNLIERINKKGVLEGDRIGIFEYDPIAVKPYNMLTPEERKIRDARYPKARALKGSSPIGTANIPQPNINVTGGVPNGQTIPQQTGPYSITYPTFDNQQSTQNVYFQNEGSWLNMINNLQQTPRSKQQGSSYGSALYDARPDAKYQQGGEFENLAPVEVVGLRDKQTRDFYNYLQNSQPDQYYAMKMMGDKHGYSNIRFAQPSKDYWAASYNASTNTTFLPPKWRRENILGNFKYDDMDALKQSSDEKYDERNKLILAELAHKKQYDKDKIGSYIRSWKGHLNPKGYMSNYKSPGSLEYEAHEIIEPKLIEEYYKYYNESENDKYQQGGEMNPIQTIKRKEYPFFNMDKPKNEIRRIKPLRKAVFNQNPNDQDFTDFYKKYITSPLYREKLVNQGYKNPDDAISYRLWRNNNSPITYTNTGLFGGSAASADRIEIMPAQVDEIGGDIHGIIAHEKSHFIGGGDRRNPELHPYQFLNESEETEISLRNRSPHNGHDEFPQEAKADMDALRYLMYKDGLYDASKREFNSEDLKKAKSKYNDHQSKRLFENFKDDNLIYLMNNIAANNQPNTTPVARKGGTFQQGGEMDDPFEALYDQIYGQLDSEEKVDMVEPPTTDEVDMMAQQQQMAAAKKQQGRAIVDSFNPRQQEEYQRYQRRGDGEDFGITPDMSSAAPLPPNEAAQFAHQHYVSKGLPEHIAAGIVGNLMQESGLNPHVKGDDGKATGIAQWHPDRFRGLNRWAEKSGKNPYDLTTQLDYILEEPGEAEKVLKKLLQTQTPEQAAHVFSETYERPNKQAARNDRRAGYAKGLMGFAKGGTYYIDDVDLMNLQTNGIKYKLLD